MSRRGLRTVEFDDEAIMPSPEPEEPQLEPTTKGKRKKKKKKSKKQTSITEAAITATTSGLGVSSAEEDVAVGSKFKGTFGRGLGMVVNAVFGDADDHSYSTAYGGERVEATIFFTPDAPGGKIVVMVAGSLPSAQLEDGDSSDDEDDIPPPPPGRAADTFANGWTPDDGGIPAPPPRAPYSEDIEMQDMQDDMRRKKKSKSKHHAAAKRKQAKELEEDEQKRQERTPWFVYSISLVNLALLGWCIWANNGLESMEMNPLLGPKTQILVKFGAKYGPCIHPPKDEWWRFITAMFLHVGILHLVFNLSFQMTTGRQLEKSYGTKRFAIIYFVSGVGGNLFSGIFVPDQVSCGASSALYGLIGVMFIDLIQNWSKIVGPWKNLFMMLVQIVISLGIGMMPGIDNFAHVGGFVTGLLAGTVWLPNIAMGKWGLRFKKMLMVFAFFGLIVALAVGFVIFYLAVPSESWCPWCRCVQR